MIQAASPMLDWSDLVQAEPSLRDFERAAREAAANRWQDWAGWFPQYSGFKDLVGRFARNPELQSAAAWHVASDHLVATFRAEWRRVWGGEPARARR